LSLATFVFVTSAKSASAFWPFDGWKNNNQGQEQVEDKPRFSKLIQRLVDKFSLNEDEVEDVIEEVREEQKEEVKMRYENKMGQLVENGILTQEQVELIEAKREELKSQAGELEGLTREEKKEVMVQHKEELKVWADENGIEIGMLAPMGKSKPNRGFMGRFRK